MMLLRAWATHMVGRVGHLVLRLLGLHPALTVLRWVLHVMRKNSYLLSIGAVVSRNEF